METLWREFFEMLKLNLLFLVTCIPIVTIPASITAMSRITVTMVQDKNHFLWPDYWKAFKRDFLKSLLGGLILAAMVAAFSISTWFYYRLMRENTFFVILAGGSACLLLSALMMSLYFYPMLAVVDLPTLQLIKNSCILTFVNIKRSLPAPPALCLVRGARYRAAALQRALCSFDYVFNHQFFVMVFSLPAIESRVLEQEPAPAHS